VSHSTSIPGTFAVLAESHWPAHPVGTVFVPSISEFPACSKWSFAVIAAEQQKS
jgi:hypothetical protein